jgi:hypothetical protein
MILRGGWKLAPGDRIVIGLDDTRPWTIVTREAVATASVRDSIWVTLCLQRGEQERGSIKLMVDDLVWTKPQIATEGVDAAA